MEWIVTDNIDREVWRRLLEFANIELTLDYIQRKHGPPKNAADKKNYQKQAEQARVCVLQAKEYFDAAKASSLITSPNHLYYGLVSLSSMQMLLFGDGRNSLDYLRKRPQNNNHGLRFSTGCTSTTADTGLAILENSFAEILASGHFSLWYECLPRRVNLYAVHHATWVGGEYTDYRVCGGTTMAPGAALLGRKSSALSLLMHLPDLSQDLGRYGIPVSAVRSSTEVRIRDGLARQVWAFHQAFGPMALDGVLQRFEVPARAAEFLVPRETSSGRVAGVEVVYDGKTEFVFRWPEHRETLDHETISYADPIDTPELVDGYIFAYQVSMLSRYFPDLWVACIESHCKAAKLIERVVNVLVTKAPILVLSMLSEDGVTISTHRAPWK